MTESIVQVNGLLTAGCSRNVEKALMRLSGVHHVSANSLNSTATVHYDEAQVSLAQIQAAVADCGYVCAGEAAPDHVAHAGHAMPAAPALGHAAHETGAAKDHSAHGAHAGMTADEMARDMRNRFFVSLALTLPVFLFSHLATQILSLHLTLPFGMSDKLFGFLLTTPVVVYGAWPFYIGARNGLQQGALNMSVLVALSVLTG